MATRIQLRRDISSNWTSVNPILGEGEIGIEIDTNKFKIGNGILNWNTLNYYSESSTIISKFVFNEVPLGTLAFKRNEAELFFSTSVVKVTKDTNQLALYFSRAPIPYPKELLGATGLDWINKINNIKEISFLHHVGVYAFRYHSLCKFAKIMASSNLEICESLEQLRALEAGWKILVTEATKEPFGIDTPEDLKKAKFHFQKIKDTIL